MPLDDERYQRVLRKLGPLRCEQLRLRAASMGTTIYHLIADLAETKDLLDRAKWTNLRELEWEEKPDGTCGRRD